jgi:hypothetical protein
MPGKLNILIIGDSFAADWSVKYQDYPGWPNLLGQDHCVVNLAQAGVGEYKILQQLTNFGNLDQIDLVLVSHTSAYRVHTPLHPVHATDALHANADLMLKDLEYHADKITNCLNYSLHTAIDYFRYHFDQEYYETVYTLIRENINQKLSNTPVIVLNNLPESLQFATESTVLDFAELWKTYPGLINHFSQTGNEIIYNKLTTTIHSMNIGDK